MHGKCRSTNARHGGLVAIKVRTYDLDIQSTADRAASAGDPTALFADRMGFALVRSLQFLQKRGVGKSEASISP